MDGGDGNDTVDYSARTASIIAEIDVAPDGTGTGTGGQAGEHDTFCQSRRLWEELATIHFLSQVEAMAAMSLWALRLLFAGGRTGR